MTTRRQRSSPAVKRRGRRRDRRRYVLRRDARRAYTVHMLSCFDAPTPQEEP